MAQEGQDTDQSSLRFVRRMMSVYGQGRGADWWNNEPAVNGLWNAIFNHIYPSPGETNGYEIQPEARYMADTLAHRADFLVTRYMNKQSIPQCLYEGKGSSVKVSEKTGKDQSPTVYFDHVESQLRKWISPEQLKKTPWVGKFWVIGAIGEDFRLWIGTVTATTYDIMPVNLAGSPDQPFVSKPRLGGSDKDGETYRNRYLATHGEYGIVKANWQTETPYLLWLISLLQRWPVPEDAVLKDPASGAGGAGGIAGPPSRDKDEDDIGMIVSKRPRN